MEIVTCSLSIFFLLENIVMKPKTRLWLTDSWEWFFVGEDTKDEIKFGREADEEDGNCSQESWGMQSSSSTTALATVESIRTNAKDEQPAQFSLVDQQKMQLFPLQRPGLIQTKDHVLYLLDLKMHEKNFIPFLCKGKVWKKVPLDFTIELSLEEHFEKNSTLTSFR